MFKASTTTAAKAATASSTVVTLDLMVLAAVIVGLGVALALFGNPLAFAIGAGLIVTVFGLAMSAIYTRYIN